MGFLLNFFCFIIDIRFEKNQFFDLIILTMKFIFFQFLGVAMLMMLYAFAAPLSEERRREENEMMQNGPGDEMEKRGTGVTDWKEEKRGTGVTGRKKSEE